MGTDNDVGTRALHVHRVGLVSYRGDLMWPSPLSAKARKPELVPLFHFPRNAIFATGGEREDEVATDKVFHGGGLYDARTQ